MENEDFNVGKKKKVLSKDSDDKKGDDFKFDTNDPRFNALFTSHLYHIDPSDQQYKKTNAMDELIKVKSKKKNEFQTNVEKQIDKNDDNKKEIYSLINSVKNKTNLKFNNKIKK